MIQLARRTDAIAKSFWVFRSVWSGSICVDRLERSVERSEVHKEA